MTLWLYCHHNTTVCTVCSIVQNCILVFIIIIICPWPYISVLPVTKLSPYIALNSSNLLPSTILAITWKRFHCPHHSWFSNTKTIINKFHEQLLITNNNNSMATKHLSVSDKRFSMISLATKCCWHISLLLWHQKTSLSCLLQCHKDLQMDAKGVQ